MNKTIVSTSLLELGNFFDANLLSKPSIKFGHDSKYLFTIFEFIEKKLFKKCINNTIRLKRYNDLKKQFLELYEQIQTKEKELEGKTEHITQGSLYFIPSLDKKSEELFGRFIWQSRRYASKNLYG